MVHTLHIDNFSRPSNSKPITGWGIAMRVAEHNGRGVRCNYPKVIGYFI